jgi:hypothetical protein
MDPQEQPLDLGPDALTEVRARAYIDLVGLAKLAGDLHKENRDLRFQVESSTRLYQNKNRIIQQFAQKLHDYREAIKNTVARAGGLEAVRDLETEINRIDRNLPTNLPPKNEN